MVDFITNIWPQGTLVMHKLQRYKGQIEGITTISQLFTGDKECAWQYRVKILGFERMKIAHPEELEIITEPLGFQGRDTEDNRESPLRNQYHFIKNYYPEHVVFFQVGSFYNIYLDDSEIVSDILGIEIYECPMLKIPACGVPFEHPEGSVRKLLRAGRKVVLCDQVDGPSQFSGILRREVVKKFESLNDLPI